MLQQINLIPDNPYDATYDWSRILSLLSKSIILAVLHDVVQ